VIRLFICIREVVLFPVVATFAVMSFPHLSWDVLIVLSIALIVVLFLILYFAVALWEKHPVSTFVAADAPAAPSVPDSKVLQYKDDLNLPPYVAVTNEMVAAAGFEGPFICRHRKGGGYRILAAMWMSPDRQILVVCAAGTMVRLPSRTTLLYSRVGAKLFITLDEWRIIDPSGATEVAVVNRGDFPELFALHRQRIAGVAAAIRPYQDDPVESYRQDEEFRAVSLERAGFARFIDPERTVWRYTLRGAIAMTKGLMDQFRHASKAAKQNKDRSRKPRPGDANYQIVDLYEKEEPG
jgi:hypothetical protein